MASKSGEVWPALPLEEWQATCETLHMWTQIVGKIRLGLMPWINHSWHVPFYVSARGLTTSAMPAGGRSVEIEFDFSAHVLEMRTSDGGREILPLEPMSVASFHAGTQSMLRALDIHVRTWPHPVEVVDAIPFDEDVAHASYDPEYANRLWRILIQSTRVLTEFRARYIGKVSPVHFFWGSFDLAVSRFSGRRAPPHPGGVPNLADRITREAYSHEVSSAGWWPGNGPLGMPAFYSYAYPTPDGFANAPVRPDAAFFSNQLGEFLLPYDAVRLAADPDAMLLEFLQSTYEAAARLADWNRDALEADVEPLAERAPR